jgi:hypothetical protein
VSAAAAHGAEHGELVGAHADGGEVRQPFPEDVDADRRKNIEEMASGPPPQMILEVSHERSSCGRRKCDASLTGRHDEWRMAGDSSSLSSRLAGVPAHDVPRNTR